MSLSLHQWYRIGFVSVLILWLSAFFLNAFQDYLLYIDSAAPENPSVQFDITTTSDTKGTNLGAFYLMGKPPKDSPTSAPKPEKLPETRLDLELRGVFDSRGPMLSGAVIESGSQRPGFFQVGDVIDEAVTLAAIEGQTVIIDRNGKLEKLSFDRSLLGFDTYTRTKNRTYIEAPLLQRPGKTDPKKPPARQERLEDRLAKLRRQHHRDN